MSVKKILSLTVLSAVVSGCFGGGSMTKSKLEEYREILSQKTSGTATSNYSSSRTTNGYNLYSQHKSSGLGSAYNKGWTGQGQKIAIIERNNTSGEDKSTFSADNKVLYGKHYKIKTGGNISETTLSTPAAPFHPRMVTELSVHQKWGIAPKAKADTYTIIHTNNDMTILKNVTNKHLNDGTVAITNSWGGGDNYKIDYYTSPLVDAAAGKDFTGTTGKRYYIDHGTSKFSGLATYIATDGAKADADQAHGVCRGATYKATSAYTGLSTQNKEYFDLVNNYICKGIAYDKLTDNDFKKFHTGYIDEWYKWIEKLKKGEIKDIPIIVIAAANTGAKNPHLMAGAIHREYLKQKARGDKVTIADYWLSVVNIQAKDFGLDKTKAGYSVSAEEHKDRMVKSSNECGLTWLYCMGAYGMRTDIYNSKRADGSENPAGGGAGTSAAAPVVAGGLAVLKQAFPSKKNAWIRKRMLLSARHKTAEGNKIKDKTGKEVKIYDRAIYEETGKLVEIKYDDDRPGISKEFGSGIMRIDKAITPFSPTKLAMAGDSMDTADLTETKNTWVLSHLVFGDGVKSSFGKINTYAFDNMNGEFKTNLGDLVVASNYDQTDNFLNKPTRTFNVYTPYFGLDVNYARNVSAGNDRHFHQKTTAVPYAQGNDLVFGANNSDYRFITAVSRDNKRINTQIKYNNFAYGIMYENDYMLGTKMSGGFGNDIRTNTAYMTYNKSTNYNGWDLSVGSVHSVSKVRGAGGMIKDISNLMASSYQINATTQTEQGLFGISAKQPLRLENGNMTVKYVNKIDSKNNLTYNTKNINITPTGRQINLETFFQPKDSNFDFRSFYKFDNGHTAGRKDVGIAINYDIKF